MLLKTQKKSAFSLVELLISLIVISCISAAFAPLITKKVKNTFVISGGTSGDTVMEVMCANLFGDNCIRCTKECTKCTTTHYLTPEKTCSSCQAGYFCDGTSITMPCSDKFGEGCKICDSTKCMVAQEGYFINNSGYSISCSAQYDPYCGNCNEIQCNACKYGYAFNENRQCVTTCLPGSKEYINSGTYEFTVPDGCTSITATLVGGGGGGGAGSIKEGSRLFTSTTNWTITSYLKNSYAKIYAVGGGGGGGANSQNELSGNGGYGGFVNGAVFKIPDINSITAYIGTGGNGGTGEKGGYGGGATYLSIHNSDSALVAGGGGGGGGHISNGTKGKEANTSNGGIGGYQEWGTYSGQAGSGGNGKPAIITSIRDSIFNNEKYGNYGPRSNYKSSPGIAGQSGAIKIYYSVENTGASGGATGSIVPKQKINNITGKLTIIVGAGGTGGKAGGYNANGTFSNSTNGNKGEQTIIKNNSGAIVLQTLSIDNGGKSNGYGATGSMVTNGTSNNPISVEGFSVGNSSSTGSTTGTNGAMSTIGGANYCSGGSGNSNGTGGNGTNYGGCGGGGGSGGYNGGKGSPGYVKLEWGV